MLANRRIRVFVSSTFCDMVGEREELMSQTWPELRRFCRERQVELVEVDLRWGIAEAQSTRRETLKLCLDEIRACRPFFLGLLGERYGWTPGDDAFTADLKEEQPWLKDLHGKSVTELEILHGVLNHPDMAGRAFFYFRDPKFIESIPESERKNFATENTASAEKQKQLKETIRPTCAAKKIPLRENYFDPRQLAAFVLEDLKAVIEAQFPKDNIPDPLTREARDHEAFAEIRCRTYIGRDDYFQTLDRFAIAGDVPRPLGVPPPGSSPDRVNAELQTEAADKPLILLGDSGSGKSALLANWLDHWRAAHPQDFIFQHYIGGTPDSAEHWRLMTRLVAEIKRWSGDPDDVPRSHDDLLRVFPVWLAKARSKAAHDGVRCIVVLDALNQLDDRDHARTLGWLPAHPFNGPLRLIVSTLEGDPQRGGNPQEALKPRGWQTLLVEPLTADERRRMIEHYLGRFGKKLDAHRLERLAAAPAAANPLYLKILLDELRVTGTHDRLDERLNDYLSAPDIPALLKKVLARYQRDYERDRPGLVGEALGLIWAARRGLTENELLGSSDKSKVQNLKSEIRKLPPTIWNPLRSALEDGLVDRGGILNFAHDFLRTAVETAFVPDEDKRDELRLRLADFFEAEPVTARSCGELPWLLWQTESFARLRNCLLDIDGFLEIFKRDQVELMSYWVGLGEDRRMGQPYLYSFEQWLTNVRPDQTRISYASNDLGVFLDIAALYSDAETLKRRALAVAESSLGPDHLTVANRLNNLAELLKAMNRLDEAEPLLRRSLAIAEKHFGSEGSTIAGRLNNLSGLYHQMNRLDEAESLIRRALTIDEQNYGPNHPDVARDLNNLAVLLMETSRLTEAEPMIRRALKINERSYDQNHPKVAYSLRILTGLLRATKRLTKAELIIRRALTIDEQNYGPNHPDVASDLKELSGLLHATKRLAEAEPMMRRALAIDEQIHGPNHPTISNDLNNLAGLLHSTNRLAEAEPLYRQALLIDERSLGPDHPHVAICLSNLASLLQDTNRLAQAEPLMRRHLEIFLKFTRATGHRHPHLKGAVNNYARLLKAMDFSQAQILVQINAICQPYGIQFGGS